MKSILRYLQGIKIKNLSIGLWFMAGIFALILGVISLPSFNGILSIIAGLIVIISNFERF